MWQKFPPVHAIAWIPFFKNFRHKFYPGYTEYSGSSGRRKNACSLLFHSGNDPDFNQNILHDGKAIDEFLKKKNYRAALLLRNIMLKRYSDGTLTVTSTTPPRELVIGYTPFRNIFPRGQRVLYYSKGVGGIGSELEPDYLVFPDRVFITYQVLFRVGRIANLVAKILTGHYAPKAKMRVDYEVWADGTYKVLVSGSLIPSQNWHFAGNDWKHDMLSASAEEIKRFMEQDFPSAIAEGNYTPHHIS